MGDQPEASDLHYFDTSYDTSNKKCFVHGDVYQLKILMLFLHRINDNIAAQYGLATEMKAASEFNDVVLCELEGNQKFYRCLQAKHKLKTSNKISDKELLKKKQQHGDYYLPKYFDSYRNMIKNVPFNSNEHKVRDLILFTNLDLDCVKLSDRGIETEEIDDPILKLSVPDSMVNKPKRYKLSVPDKKNDIYKTLKQYSYDRLASKLVNDIKQKITLKMNGIYKQRNVALMENVLEKIPMKRGTKYFCRFREKFLLENPNNQDTLQFCEAMRRCWKNADDKEFVKEIRNKQLQVSKSFYESKRGEPSDTLGDVVNDEDIDDFFEKFVFAVNQPNEIKLGEILNKEIGARFDLMDADPFTSQLQLKVIDWLKERKGTWMTKNLIEQWFEEIDTKLSRLVFMYGRAQKSRCLCDVSQALEKIVQAQTKIIQAQKKILRANEKISQACEQIPQACDILSQACEQIFQACDILSQACEQISQACDILSQALEKISQAQEETFQAREKTDQADKIVTSLGACSLCLQKIF